MKFVPAGSGLPPTTPIAPDDEAWLSTVFERMEWRFAKSMPHIPHFYTHKDQDWESPGDYVRAGTLILLHGTPESLWNFPVRRYLYVGAWRYWLMTTDVSESYIMNRCDPAHPRYAGAIRPAKE